MLLVEQTFEGIDSEIITEGVGDQKQLYITGVFAQADVVNRNKRIYPDSVLQPEVERYISEKVKTNMALGELDHPEEGRPTIKAERATHLITELSKEGSNYIGKARILPTPMGNLVKSLLEGGVKIGVSTRGSGKVKLNRDSINEVQKGYKMHCIDTVLNPSAPDAFVEHLVESDVFEEILNLDKGILLEFENFLAQRKAIKESSREQRFDLAVKALDDVLKSFRV